MPSGTSSCTKFKHCGLHYSEINSIQPSWSQRHDWTCPDGDGDGLHPRNLKVEVVVAAAEVAAAVAVAASGGGGSGRAGGAITATGVVRVVQ